ncbi:zf-HC2 domain-containing protein [Kocuria sp. NPDC057446]|uniref:zf-HC2 domain-containing protein n=1 Tax=Kocuria sp. NPDC057446 TaxID=3346137 RepID=UPI0036C1AE93
MTRPAHARPHGPSGDSETPRDDVLLDAAHAGDADAFAALRERYRGTALAVARSRTGSPEEAERVAAAALGRIEQIVGEGGGPRAFLGAFVVWMVGREADGGTRPVALPDDPADPSSLVRVFSGLPAEWQGFLWRTEVLGQSARRASAALGLGAVAAAGLHRDMVRGLRGLYGRAAADREAGPDCAEFSGELPHFVRGTRGQRSRRDVKAHLDGCARCTAEYLSRQDVGTGLRTWTLPVLAGLPLWGTESLELTNLIAGAGTAAAAAAPGAVGAGRAPGTPAAGAAAGAHRARPDGGAGASAWSGRRAKVLLGAGALATAAVVATVGVSGGGDPVPAADSLAAEQAPRTAEDLEAPRADDRAARAEQAEDDASDAGASAREPEDGPAGANGTSVDRGPAEAPAGTGENGAGEPGADGNRAGGNGAGEQGESGNGAGQESVALAAGPSRSGGDARSATDAAAGAGGSSAGTPGSAGADRQVTGAQRPASGAAAGRGVEPGTSGAASAGGAVQTPPSGGSSTSTPPAHRADVPVSTPAPPPAPAKTTAPAPIPSLMPSRPSPAASPAPLKAPVPGWTPAPPSDPGTLPGTRGRHAHQAGVAPGGQRAEHRSERQRRSGQQQGEKGWRGKGAENRQDAGRNGRGAEREQHGRGPRSGAGGAEEGRAHR